MLGLGDIVSSFHRNYLFHSLVCYVFFLAACLKLFLCLCDLFKIITTKVFNQQALDGHKNTIRLTRGSPIVKVPGDVPPTRVYFFGILI